VAESPKIRILGKSENPEDGLVGDFTMNNLTQDHKDMPLILLAGLERY
jgi:hypothetical protein